MAVAVCPGKASCPSQLGHSLRLFVLMVPLGAFGGALARGLCRVASGRHTKQPPEVRGRPSSGGRRAAEDTRRTLDSSLRPPATPCRCRAVAPPSARAAPLTAVGTGVDLQRGRREETARARVSPSNSHERASSVPADPCRTPPPPRKCDHPTSARSRGGGRPGVGGVPKTTDRRRSRRSFIIGRSPSSSPSSRRATSCPSSARCGRARRLRRLRRRRWRRRRR